VPKMETLVRGVRDSCPKTMVSLCALANLYGDERVPEYGQSL
jgi:hypothetical protein